jgi:hypothetical protein
VLITKKLDPNRLERCTLPDYVNAVTLQERTDAYNDIMHHPDALPVTLYVFEPNDTYTIYFGSYTECEAIFDVAGTLYQYTCEFAHVYEY